MQFKIFLFRYKVNWVPHLRPTWPTLQNITVKKACRGWINYCNICSKAELICCTLHLVLLPLVSWGVVTKFTLVWGNFLPIYWITVVSGFIIRVMCKPLPKLHCCWVEKRESLFFILCVCLPCCKCYTLKAMFNFIELSSAKCFFFCSASIYNLAHFCSVTSYNTSMQCVGGFLENM